MPIYEYQCQACEAVTDALQKINDAPLRTCPECNEDALKKLISAPRFRLVGSGWYETDFKSKNQRNLVKQETEKTEKSSSDNGSAADKKSDAKKEAKTAPSQSEAKV